MSAPTALLVGYNGANNTGAEALLQADIADLRAVLGPDARLTVPTLNAANLRRYLQPGPTLRIAPIPTVFFAAVRRLVREHDLVVLVEGSAYMDTWTPALLWYFLWATRCADEAGKPSLAYAVDAGQLSRLDRWLTSRVASRSELIVTRAEAAADRLRSWGVTAPITVTADNAFNFQPDPRDAAWLAARWPEGAGAVGLALVDFSRFPVVVRPWGRREDCYRWPYYFAHSPARRRMSRALAEDLFVEGGASPEVFAAVTQRVERLLADPAPVRAALRHGYQVHAAAARRNRELLRGFALRHGWGEPAWAA